MVRNITLEVNNQQIMRLSQEKHDDTILLQVGTSNNINESEKIYISQGDFVMLMNHYRIQQEKEEDTIKCPLCEKELSYREIKDTHMWSCLDCPAILFEFVDERDAIEVTKQLLKI